MTVKDLLNSPSNLTPLQGIIKVIDKMKACNYKGQTHRLALPYSLRQLLLEK